MLFGLGPLEIGLIILAIVLLFGATKVRSLLRGAGEGVREFKDALKEPDEEDAEVAQASDKDAGGAESSDDASGGDDGD